MTVLDFPLGSKLDRVDAPRLPGVRSSKPRNGTARANRIPSLDGLRAVSILLVIAFHTVNAISWRKTGHDYDGVLKYLLNGGLGVSVFFVISGYLITHLLLKELSRTGKIELRDFYIRRSFRIWPAFYFFLAVVAILHLTGRLPINMKRDFVAAAAFVFNYTPHAGSAWVGHTWSLAVEEQFYLLWPAVLILMGVKRTRLIAVTLLLIIPAVRFFEVSVLPAHGLLRSRLWQTSHTRADTLMLGSLMALCADSVRFGGAIRGLFDKKIHWVALVLLFANWALMHQLPLPMAYALGYSIEAGCIGLLILWAIDRPHVGVGRFLNAPAVVHVGNISYSLYLWNVLFCIPLNPGWTGTFPLNLVCTFAMAELSYFFIEQPVLRWRAAMKSRRRDEPAVPGLASVVCMARGPFTGQLIVRPAFEVETGHY